MNKVTIEAFKVIGISVRTSNNNGESAKDIGKLWEKFMTEGIIEKIPNRVSDEILSIYTNYEGDHTKPYDTILGCKVSSLDLIPEGMVSQVFEASAYAEFNCKGDLTQGAVYKKWIEIWNTELDRTYLADFEIYGEKAKEITSAELNIYVSIKS